MPVILELTHAIVIAVKPYSETSVLAELFCATHGRIALIAKGARNPTSKWRGLFQVFNSLLITATAKHSDLMTVQAAETHRPFYRLPKENLRYGFYFNQLLLTLMLRGESYPQVFEEYYQALLSLSGDIQQINHILRRFEKKFLYEIGYGVDFNFTHTGENIHPQHYYYFKQNRGFWLAPDALDAFLGKTLLAIGINDFSELETLLAAKCILKQALMHARMNKL